MWSVITYLIAIAVMIPFFITWLIYKINRMMRKPRLYAFHKAVNWSTFLYVVSVTMMSKVIFNHYYIGYIIVFYLICLIIIIVVQRVNYTEVDIAKAFKIVWRFSFLLFSFLYIILILVGIINQL